MHTPPPVTPYLVVSDAAAAIEFYKAAFGAVETDRHLAPGGDKILHVRLDINGGIIMLSDDFAGMMQRRVRRRRPSVDRRLRWRCSLPRSTRPGTRPSQLAPS